MPQKNNSANVWLYDVTRSGTGHPFTDDTGDEWWTVWTPDGKRVIFHSSRDGKSLNLYWKSVDGIGEIVRLTESANDQSPYAISSDGKMLFYMEHNRLTSNKDIWVLPLEGDRTPRPLLQTPAQEFGPTLSPDGRWLAYVSDETGRQEVYVRNYPDLGRVIKISSEGGVSPMWSSAGDYLYFRQGRKMMAVSFLPEPGIPKVLFEGDFVLGHRWGRRYDLSPDGKRFLMIRESEPPSSPTQYNIVLNWFDELKQKVETGN
ncbi:hypothetical protein BVY00_01310 [bacterium G20]|nr:hypothetical protein BVY00_01310 [bacterium G20]